MYYCHYYYHGFFFFLTKVIRVMRKPNYAEPMCRPWFYQFAPQILQSLSAGVVGCASSRRGCVTRKGTAQMDLMKKTVVKKYCITGIWENLISREEECS